MTGPQDGASLEALAERHDRRMHALDALVPPVERPVANPAGTPEPTTYGVRSERVLHTDHAVGLGRWLTLDPESQSATWGALATASLSRVALDPPDDAGAVGAMDELLDAWRDDLVLGADPTIGAAARGELPDTAAGLLWPSRDVAMTRAFLAHGLSAKIAVAVRPAGRAAPESPERAAVRIRDLRPADVDAAAALQLEVVRWDAWFGGVTLRGSSAARGRDDVVEHLGRDRTSSWVAEEDGRVVGLLSVDWPPDSGWVAPLVAVEPGRVGYLGTLSVDPSRRSSGIGAAMVRVLHRELDAAGIDVTLLHHSVLNPLSTPFWHRCGYRPLWTSWDVRPHTWLR